MQPDTFLTNALQYGRDRDQSGLCRWICRGLTEDRPMVLSKIGDLSAHAGQHIKGALFDAALQDGGTDLMPLIIQIFQSTREPDLVRERLARLSEHPRPEILDLTEALAPILGPRHDKDLRRTLGKLRARFRRHFYLRSFAMAEGRHLEETAQAMIREFYPEYLALITYLRTGSPERTLHAARILRAHPHPDTLGALPESLRRLQSEATRLRLFSELPLLHGDVADWSARRLLYALREAGHPMSEKEAETKVASWQQGISGADLEALLAPFPLDAPCRTPLKSLMARVITGIGDKPDPDRLNQSLGHLLAVYDAAWCELLGLAGDLSIKLKKPDTRDWVEQCLQEVPESRNRGHIWFLAGQADSKALETLTGMLNQPLDAAILADLLHLLPNLSLDSIPAALLALAGQTDNPVMRQAALDFIAQSPLGPPHLERLLNLGPMVVKEDVGAAIARYRIVECVPLLVGLLTSKITDQFRIILIETLATFDGPDTGLPVRTFLGSGHALPVRTAALKTLIKAGGPDRIKLIVETLQSDEGKRHRTDIHLTFLEQVLDHVASTEQDLLDQKRFFERLLLDEDVAVREACLTVLDRFHWPAPGREGWVGLLQKALHTLIGRRSHMELERLRSLVDRVSALFESERKAVALRRRLGGIVTGLQQKTRMERLVALKQLDWIFRPEMIAGDREGVKRLVRRIEFVLDHDAGDQEIEVQAIEVAGKIGHPALRRKIREYLDCPNPSLAHAAEAALKRPVDESLLADLIRTVFHLDDSVYMTRMVGTLLQSEGFIATGANAPDEALSILRNGEFDLLILDLNMPQIRGVDFLRKIRALELAPRFTFVLTSVRNQEDLVEVFHEGVDGVLLKPLQAEELVQKIRELKDACS